MHAVTCRTDGCQNEGFTLILSNPGHTVICGPCGLVVGDVEPVLLPDPEEPDPESDSDPVPEDPEDPENPAE